MKRMKKFIALALGISMITASMVGCSSATTDSSSANTDGAKTEQSQTEGTDGESLTIGLALSALSTNAVFIDMKNTIQERCDEAGYKLIATDIEGGTEVAITAMENFINAGCDVIILQNSAEEACADVLQRAVDAGIIVGSYDNESDICQYEVMCSNYEVGKLIGKTAGEWANEHEGSKKAAICGYSNLPFLIERAQGIRDGYTEACPDGEVVAELDAGYANEGVTAGENFLQVAPDIEVVMGINDGGVLGVYEAFKAAGKSAADNIGLFGCDASEDGLNAIKEEDMFVATVDMDLINQVSNLFDRCVQSALTGEINEAEKSVTYPYDIVTINEIQ